MSWTDIDITDTGSTDFLTLKEGDNVVRIISAPVERYVVWSEADGKSIAVNSPDEEYNGQKPKKRFLTYVIDRSDGKIKLFEMGISIAKELRNLAVSEQYGFEEAPDYDITIKRTGTGFKTRYTILPARENTELTEEELKAISELTPLNEVLEQLNG